MKELILEFVICGAAASFLMVVHELFKAMVYMGIRRYRGNRRAYSHSIWEVQRYLDPVGIILSITSGVAFSRPFMFRIQDKKTNRILGYTGFSIIIFCFGVSMAALKCRVFGVSGMETLEGRGLTAKIITLFIQYIALISFGMFCTNLFPVSTFDMGLLIAGHSSEKYLGIIKMDAIIKVIFMVTVFLDLIGYWGYRLLSFLLQ